MEGRKSSGIRIILVLMTLSFSGFGCAAGRPDNTGSALILSAAEASRIIGSYWKDNGRQYAEMNSRVGTTPYEQTIRYINSGYAEKDALPSPFGNTGFKITEKGAGLFKSLCLNPDNGGFRAEVLTHEPDLVSVDDIAIDEKTGTATVTATFEDKLTEEFKNFISPMADYVKDGYKESTYRKEFSLHKSGGNWQIESP